ncbi:MAG: glycosyltransferase family 2 protein [Parachlamydia sp.]|nr:glycosyltransferase family 2 protein [Parachlamydia sp.]
MIIRNKVCLILAFFFFCGGWCQASPPPVQPQTVLLAILARNKAHLLTDYLTCIERLTYRKKLITVYINTNNNDDNTRQILQGWAKKNRSRYRKIIFDAHDVPALKRTKPHEWNSQRFKVLGKIRNKSLHAALQNQCEFYFVVDCDNFIAPCTLRELVKKNLPIVAPMLRAIPIPNDTYSNFLTKIKVGERTIETNGYFQILRRTKIGTFEVPVVHCTYLVKSEFIPRLSYTDHTGHYEFVIFSRHARQNVVPQYICNEKDFGALLHLGTKLTLAEERTQVRQIGSLIPECGTCCR